MRRSRSGHSNLPNGPSFCPPEHQEREFILQAIIGYKSRIPPEEVFDANDRSNYSGGPLPRRYESLVLPKDWHVPGKLTRRRRAHRKSHGAIRFHEMNEKISTAWKAADVEVRRFCVDLSASEAARSNRRSQPTRPKEGAERRIRTNDQRAAATRLEERVTHNAAAVGSAAREALATRRESVVTPELQPRPAPSSTTVRIGAPTPLEAISGSNCSPRRRNSVSSTICCDDPFFADLESDAIFMSLFETTVDSQAPSSTTSSGQLVTQKCGVRDAALHPPQCYEIPEIVPPPGPIHDCLAAVVPNPLLFEHVDMPVPSQEIIVLEPRLHQVNRAT